jgi:hypothetical protein
MLNMHSTPTFAAEAATALPPHTGIAGRCLALLLLLLCGLPIQAEAAVEPVTTCTSKPANEVIAFGQVVDCDLAYVGATDIYRFQGTAKSTVVLSLRTTSYFGSSCYYSEFCAVAKVYTPGAMDVPLATLTTADSQALTLPITGTYLVVVQDDNHGNQGSYRLGLERLFPTSPTSRRMDFGVVTNDIDPVLDQDFYTFDASKNDFVSISSTNDMVVDFYAPDQALLFTVKGATPQFVTLPTEGRYTVHVHDSGNNKTRPYSINLVCLILLCQIHSNALADRRA